MLVTSLQGSLGGNYKHMHNLNSFTQNNFGLLCNMYIVSSMGIVYHLYL
jgi:hypothetical protein